MSQIVVGVEFGFERSNTKAFEKEKKGLKIFVQV